MQTKSFFRVAVLLPLFFLLALWFFEPEVWRSYDAAEKSFDEQAIDFLRTWLCLGGGQYMLSAACALYAIERLRTRSQIQLLFALFPGIVFLICGALSILASYLLPVLGVHVRNADLGGVVLCLAALTAGSLYAFIISVVFIVLNHRRGIRSPLAGGRSGERAITG